MTEKIRPVLFVNKIDR